MFFLLARVLFDVTMFGLNCTQASQQAHLYLARTFVQQGDQALAESHFLIAAALVRRILGFA